MRRPARPTVVLAGHVTHDATSPRARPTRTHRTVSHPRSRVPVVALPRFAVVDVETSGLSFSRHRVLQLAVVTVDPDGTVVDRWSTLVALPHRWSRVGPTHVHGLTRRRLKGAPLIDDVLDELARRLDGSLFTAHNARFDGEFLLRAARRHGDPALIRSLERRLCTLRMSRRLDPDRTMSHRLGDVAERYGVRLVNAHDAAADAEATALVLPHLLAAHGVTDVDDLDPFLDRPRPRLTVAERVRRRIRRWTRRLRPSRSSSGGPTVEAQ